MRTGRRRILDGEDGIEMVREAAGGDEIIALVGRLRADVLLLEVRMPGIDGIEASRRILAEPARPSATS